ncbi:unnamed protein product [Amaranthus hypochondriacus]
MRQKFRAKDGNKTKGDAASEPKGALGMNFGTNGHKEVGNGLDMVQQPVEAGSNPIDVPVCLEVQEQVVVAAPVSDSPIAVDGTGSPSAIVRPSSLTLHNDFNVLAVPHDNDDQGFSARVITLGTDPIADKD